MWVTIVSCNWSIVSKVTVNQLQLAKITQTIPDILASNTNAQSSRSFWSEQFQVVSLFCFGADDEGSPEASRLSWCGSLQRQGSSISNVHEKMRQMRSSSLQGSKQSLRRSRHHSTSKSPHGTLERTGSHFSRGSEASFYSCGSLLDELDRG